MNDFKTLDMEIDIMFSEMVLHNTFYANSELFTESSDEKVESFFDKFITRAKEIVDSIRNKISDIFNKKQTDDVIKKAETAIEANQKLGNTKVKIPDYDKLNKLNADVRKELDKTDNPEAVMKKYRLQRNKLLAASAFITVSLSTALYMLTKNKNAKISELSAQNKIYETRITKLKRLCVKFRSDNKTLSAENSELKRKNELLKARGVNKAAVMAKQTGEKIDAATNSVKAGFDQTINTAKTKAKAETEVLTNASKDIVGSFKSALNVLGGDASVIAKGGAVANSIGKTVSTVASIVSGDASANHKAETKESLKVKAKELKEKKARAQKILDGNFSPERKKNAEKFLSKVDDEIKKLHSQYKALSK